MVNQDMHSAMSSSVKKNFSRLARIGGDMPFSGYKIKLKLSIGKLRWKINKTNYLNS